MEDAFGSKSRHTTDESAPLPFSAPSQQRVSSPPRFHTTSSPPKFESDVKHAPVDEEEAFATATAPSQEESMKNSGGLSQDDEDSAGAIEESIKHASSPGIPLSFSEVDPSTSLKTTSPLSILSPSPVAEPSVRPHTPPAPSNAPRVLGPRLASKVSLSTIRPAQPNISDEVLAQRFAEEEEMTAVAEPSNPKPESPALRLEIIRPLAPAPSSTSRSRRRHESDRPKFTVVNADSGDSATLRKHREATQSKLAIINSDSELPPPAYHRVVSAQTPAPAPTPPTFPNNTVTSSSSSARPMHFVSTTPTLWHWVGQMDQTILPNSFVDQQLLYGVCESPPLPPRLHKMGMLSSALTLFP